MLCARILVYLTTQHTNEIVTSLNLQKELEELRGTITASLKAHRDLVGVNMAGLSYLLREYNATQLVFGADEGDEDILRRKKVQMIS